MMGVQRDRDRPRVIGSPRLDEPTEHHRNNRTRTIVKIGLCMAVIALVMVAVGFFVVQLRYFLYIGTAVGVVGSALVIIGILKAAFNDRDPTEPGDWTGGAWRN